MCFIGLLFCLCYDLFELDCFFKVFPDLLIDPQQLQMVTIAIALREIGYAIQVMTLICRLYLFQLLLKLNSVVE